MWFGIIKVGCKYQVLEEFAADYHDIFSTILPDYGSEMDIGIGISDTIPDGKSFFFEKS